MSRDYTLRFVQSRMDRAKIGKRARVKGFRTIKPIKVYKKKGG